MYQKKGISFKAFSGAKPPIRLLSFLPWLIYFEYHGRSAVDMSYHPFLKTLNDYLYDKLLIKIKCLQYLKD